MKPALVVIALVMAWYNGQATAGLFQEYVVHGQSRSCYSISGLDQALSTENVAYFKDWTPKDFDDAAVWAKACKDSGWQFAGRTRVETLKHFQETLNFAQLQTDRRTYEAKAAQRESAAKQLEIEKEKAAQSEREVVRMAVEQKQKQLDNCQATKAYQLYQAQEDVIENLTQKAMWQNNLAHERKIASVSGVRNLSEEYNDGAWIVQLDDDLKQYWATYKQLGGKASSPQSVKHKVTNPCTSLEPIQ